MKDVELKKVVKEEKDAPIEKQLIQEKATSTGKKKVDQTMEVKDDKMDVVKDEKVELVKDEKLITVKDDKVDVDLDVTPAKPMPAGKFKNVIIRPQSLSKRRIQLLKGKKTVDLSKPSPLVSPTKHP